MLDIFKLSIFNQITLFSYNLKVFLNDYYLIKHKSISLHAASDLFIRDSYIGGICDVYKPYGTDLV